MAKHCRNCGENNDDDRIFCCACGEPLNADLQLIMDLDKMSKNPKKTEPARTSRTDDDYTPRPAAKPKKKKSAAPWIVLILVVIVILVAVALLR